MTSNETNEAIDRAIRFIKANTRNKEHPLRIANDIINGLIAVKNNCDKHNVKNLLCECAVFQPNMKAEPYVTCLVCNKRDVNN